MHGRPGALAINGEINTVIAQKASQQVHISEIGNIFESEPVRRQQARYHQREGGVFRAGNGDSPVETLTTYDFDAIHKNLPPFFVPIGP